MPFGVGKVERKHRQYVLTKMAMTLGVKEMVCHIRICEVVSNTGTYIGGTIILSYKKNLQYYLAKMEEDDISCIVAFSVFAKSGFFTQGAIHLTRIPLWVAPG